LHFIFRILTTKEDKSMIADRLNRISESETIAMSKLGRALKAEGKDVISLSFGEPDFFTPET
jgi:aspartate aminotransferase